MKRNFIDHYRLVQRVDEQIARRGTGSNKELADKIGVSNATLYRIFDELKILGADIAYCNFRKSYFYQNNFRL